MESRNFQLDTEWNMIHYPEKPSGFGILIIGDDRHYVNENGSYWTQNEGKSAILNMLKDEGYIIFYSNLYRKNWGSEKAVKLARRLYEHIIRTEIINPKINLIAEGMGALIALKLMDEMGPQLIRGCILINPIFSLSDHLELEKEHKFFYKNLLKELAEAYELDMKYVENKIILKESFKNSLCIPTKIIHIMTDGRAYNQSKQVKTQAEKWKETGSPISICFLLPEKRMGMGTQIINFMKKNEGIL
ncbi:hydrolase [Bacillus sp. DTU_2020_1000418_1_SI_GHA_SEK_038]|uniref:hydrolase n=1 Tax=Bacillus sp. DTU_2020_1000418_1_SI_GHA_SEK_038 TaxID=3077585 RepID=UPI0028EB2472|nr:hydrolase [Bacillus sp. DTU_2020_1000418_1_SI_GHA_SEK_038]WNS76852.1 hydrolase [Bacillus sp. DTU_2020_1000418_1_SI_GHA_SEK_038]